MLLTALRALVLSVALCASVMATDVGDIPHDELGKLDGVVVKLSDSPGTVRIVSFWATWCAPCLRELPVLVQVQQQIGSDFLQVYAINYQESRSKFERLVAQLDDSSVIYLRDRKGKTGRRFGVDGIPHTILIGKDGRIAYQHIGYGTSTIDTMVEQINSLLQAEP
ncbi:MAG: TlpA disulfide reductase family protein [Pseudomonadota bacterium]